MGHIVNKYSVHDPVGTFPLHEHCLFIVDCTILEAGSTRMLSQLADTDSIGRLLDMDVGRDRMAPDQA